MFNMTQCVNKVAGSPSSTSFNRTLYNTACFGSDGCLKDQKINNDGGLDQKDRVCVGAPVNEVFLL